MQKKSRGRGPIRGDTVLGQGGCVRRIEVFLKMQKKSGSSRGVGGWSGGVGWLAARLGFSGWCEVWGCKPRIEGIVKCT